MIIVTGAAGFIGSHLIRKLNNENFKDIIAVDAFDRDQIDENLTGLKYKKIERDSFFEWLDENFEEVEFIFHLGARTDTTETDTELLSRLNTVYSKEIWKKCVAYQLPLVYASSAATYGAGENGFDDDETKLDLLKPLNAYAWSKHEFDLWAVKQEQKPFFWAGLKFFNVYGPENESHKGKMASMVYQAHQQIAETGTLKLFKSYRPEYKDGEQKRDFLSVKEVVNILYWLMHHRKNSGIYNVGTGRAQTFLEMGKKVFQDLGKEENFEFIEMPNEIRDKYQYFTEAKMEKLRGIGYQL